MDIDKSKENILPLRGGRDAARLGAALSAQTDHELRQHLKQEKLNFEHQINVYDGPDPLDPWFQYICWTEQSYPKKGYEGLLKLVEECLSKFEHNDQYKQDRRLLKLWMKYIDSTENPAEFYQMLYSQDIGTQCAEFYLGWAYYYHAAEDFKRADHIYRLGIKARAQPMDELVQAHESFQITFAQRMLFDNSPSRQRSAASLAEQRQALTSLHAIKRRNIATAPNQRTGDSVRNLFPGTVRQDQAMGNRPNAPIQIFEDEPLDNMASGLAHKPKSILDCNRAEENTTEPGPWNKVKTLQATGHVNPTLTPFTVHEDAPVLVFAPCNHDFSDWKVPLFVQDPTPNVLPMYRKEEVYCNNKEYSFDELLAREYNKHKALSQDQHYSQLLINEDDDMQIDNTINVVQHNYNHPAAPMQEVVYKPSNVSQQHHRISGPIAPVDYRQQEMYPESGQIMCRVVPQINVSIQQIYEHQNPVSPYMHGNVVNQSNYGMSPMGGGHPGSSGAVHGTHLGMGDQLHHYGDHTNENLLTSIGVNTKEEMKEVDNWYGAVSAKHSYIAQNVEQQASPQMQGFTIYQDSVSEQAQPIMTPSHNVMSERPQHPIHKTHSPLRDNGYILTENLPITEHIYNDNSIPEQGYINNENIIYDQQIHPHIHQYHHHHHQQQQQQIHLQISQHHRSPIVEQSYGNNENPHMNAPLQGHHYGSNDNVGMLMHPPESSRVHMHPGNQRYPMSPQGEISHMFNDSINTQSFNVHLGRGQISTPINTRKPPLQQQYERSPEVQQPQHSPSMQQVLPDMIRQPIAVAPSLPDLMETSREYRSSTIASEDMANATAGQSGHSKLGNSQMKHGMSQQYSNQSNNYVPSQSMHQYSSVSPHQNSYGPPVHTTVQYQNQQQLHKYNTVPQNQISKKNFAPSPVMSNQSTEVSAHVAPGPTTPVNKYTAYRVTNSVGVESQKFLSDSSSHSLPGSPEDEQQRNTNAQREIFLNQTQSPNISRSMQNNLHISTEHSIVTTSAEQVAKQETTDDYHMEYQDEDSMPVVIEEPREKEITCEKIIKMHLSKDVIDPFNSELCEAFLDKIDFPSRNNTGRCYIVSNFPKITLNSVCTIGQMSLVIESILGKGAFGTIYKAMDNATGNVLALKTQKPARVWEYYICSEIKNRITNRDMLCGFMEVSAALIGPTSSVLVSEFSRYGSLIDVNNKVRAATTKPLSQHLVMLFTSQMLSAIYHLHKCNIIHGDIKPDNILLMSIPSIGNHIPSIQFIDFGCAIDMTLFPEGSEFKKVVTTDGFTCSEMLEGRPWTYQTDLFCIAATTHVCLFGDYMKLQKKFNQWDIKSKMPRYFQKELWVEFFNKLLNIPDGKNLPNLLELKASIDAHLAIYEGDLLEKIRALSNIMNGR